jgi:hypothetical protein
VSAKGSVRADGRPKDVDREFVAIYYTAGENQSWYVTENISKYIGDPKGLKRTRNSFSGTSTENESP